MEAALAAINQVLARLEGKLDTVAMTNEELLAKVDEAFTLTNEIADDLQEALSTEPISDEAKARVEALVVRLQGVAAIVPEPEAPPVEEPPAEETPPAE